VSQFKELPPELVARATAGAEGCDEVAWSKADALAVLACLVASEVAVLGGDVLRRSNGRTQHAYDNWYCDRDHGEAWRTYVERSHRVAEDYVRRYPDPEDGSILYTLTVGDGA
jgi:immunity protein 40 of polymorphic toxin system